MSSLTEQAMKDELRRLKEKMVRIASRYEQPISDAASNVSVITDEGIRSSGAPDMSTILRQISEHEAALIDRHSTSSLYTLKH